VRLLPSGKGLRRNIRVITEGRDPGDLTALDDPAEIERIRVAVRRSPDGCTAPRNT